MTIIQSLRRAPVRAVRRVEGLGRRCIGACLLLCYVVGTVGLPAPSLGAIAANGGCRCSPASVLAGTCCCSHPGVKVQRSCCVDKGDGSRVRADLSESAKRVARSCCQPKLTASALQKSGNNELRVCACPCGPDAPDASVACTDPRLPAASTTLTIELPIAARLSIASDSAPSGTLEPQIRPPRA